MPTVATTVATASSEGVLSNVIDHGGIDETDNAHLALTQDQYMQFNTVQPQQEQHQQQLEFPVSVSSRESSNVGGQFTSQPAVAMAPYSNLPSAVDTAAVADGTVQWPGSGVTQQLAQQVTQQAANAVPPGNTVPQFGSASYTDPSITNQFVISDATSHSTEMFNSAPPFSQGVTQTYPSNENFVSAQGSEQTIASVPSVSDASMYNFNSQGSATTAEQPTGLYTTGLPVSSSSFPTFSGPIQPTVPHSTSSVTQAVPFQPPTQTDTQKKTSSSEKEINKGM